MKISLLKLVQNPKERDPNVKGSEAQKFLKFLLDEDGWGNSDKAWQLVFAEYSKRAQKEFIEELKMGGWVAEQSVNWLDVELKVTDKGKQIFS